jgi:glutathione S-transferase
VKALRDIHLWWHPGSCSRVTLVALEEIGVPFRLTVPRRPTPEYFAVNPKGRVPALVVDGVVLTETPGHPDIPRGSTRPTS